MHEIRPSILANTPEEFEKMVRRLESHVDLAHLDIMDGNFVPNKTITGYEELDKIKTNLRFWVHLMVADPASVMYKWYTVGGVDGFVVHYEIRNGIRELLEQMRLNNKKTCLAVNPATRMEEVEEYLDLVDMVQVMMVEPGQYGAPIIDTMFSKISMFRERHFDIPIAVDGGMNPETGKRALQAGAEVLIVGSYIQNSPDIAKAINELKNI